MPLRSSPTSQGWQPSVPAGLRTYIPSSNGWYDGSVSPPADQLLPLGSVAFGAFVSDQGLQSHTQAVEVFSALVERMPLIDHRFHGGDNVFPYGDHPAFSSQIPLITWEPFNYTLDQLNTGALDTYLHERAIACRERASPILFRPMHEMNGNWYPWSGAANGASASAVAKYIQVWRRIYGIFQDEQATNVLFVWSPNNNSVPGTSTNPWNASSNYYPGSEYVDYIGVDGYNFGPTTVTSPMQVFGDFYAMYNSYGKAIIICETSSADNNQGAQASSPDTNQNKPQWITDLVSTLENSFPYIVGMVWFDENKEHDWRANSSPGSLAAFKTMITNSRWTSLAPEIATTPKIATLVTSFSSPPSTFGYGTGGSVSGGVARLAVGNSLNGVYNALQTVTSYDFTQSSFYLKFVPATGGTNPVTQIVIDPGVTGGSDITLSYENGQLSVGSRVNYTLQGSTSWAFVPGNYIQVSEAAGTLTVRESSDAINWTTRATFSSGSHDLSSSILKFVTWNSGGSSIDAQFDNINTSV